MLGRTGNELRLVFVCFVGQEMNIVFVRVVGQEMNIIFVCWVGQEWTLPPCLSGFTSASRTW